MNDDKFTYVRAAFEGGVTPPGKGKTWTYSPQMSVTVPARSGLRIAVLLFWDSLRALVQRDSVTFYAGGDPISGYTYETID